MAAGDAFTMVPDKVTPLEPEYHNIETPSESMKKEYHNMSATPTEGFELIFKGKTTAEREALKTHFDDQSGGYYVFSWQSVPAYIEGGTNISGRWVDGSLSMRPVAPNVWNCKINFEKDN